MATSIEALNCAIRILSEKEVNALVATLGEDESMAQKCLISIFKEQLEALKENCSNVFFTIKTAKDGRQTINYNRLVNYSDAYQPPKKVTKIRK